MAERGEFTKRAFLNGRLDLSQAEAVIDIVSAKNDAAQRSALSQLEGDLSEEVREARQELLDVLVDMAVNIDYPDEDIEVIVYEKLQEDIERISDKIGKILEGADTGRIIREGIKVAIAGKPNAGKSSLLNALLGENRAIVTDIPGTTRDAITEFISIGDIPVNIVDTAGIRDSENKIEKMGIEKSGEAIDTADLVFLVFDASRELEEEDRRVISRVRKKKLIAILNKTDLEVKLDAGSVSELLSEVPVITTSLGIDRKKTKDAVEALKTALEEMVFRGHARQENSLLVTSARHEALLKAAVSSLQDAWEMSKNEEALELIEIDVRNAYESLGEIIGETLKDDIIEEVFSRFCLGK
jgi:tRNA modification GTPase